MQICKNCPYPARCEAQQRCIAHKIGGVGTELPAPIPHPVKTTSGVSMTGKIKTGKKKAAKKNGK